MSKNQQYPIYVQWLDTLDWILNTAEKYPRTVRFSIAGRITDYALEILELIIEAIYTKERKDILTRINLLLEKLRVFFYLSQKRKHISLSQYQYISQALGATGVMVGGWAKSQ
ncbi:MAG: diversity-generating retroelement protein Avd [Candidatus Cloacimonadaceae bacterium]|jgi:flagellar biosynthesis/type III secretory pathway protein FliH